MFRLFFFYLFLKCVLRIIRRRRRRSHGVAHLFFILVIAYYVVTIMRLNGINRVGRMTLTERSSQELSDFFCPSDRRRRDIEIH